jgi:hypothetical protein
MELEELINNEYKIAAAKYHCLNPPERRGSQWYISGSMDVIDDNGKSWGTYLVDIRFPEDYPKNPPDLIETGSKIIRHEDWHVNKDGTCCLAPRAKIFLKLKNEITLLGWLENFAEPFLANHVFRERDGAYAAGEYPHFSKGIIKSYREIFGLNSDTETVQLLRYVTGDRTISRNDPCFCGSGKKYKHCYLKNTPNHTYNVPMNVLMKDLNEIKREWGRSSRA